MMNESPDSIYIAANFTSSKDDYYPNNVAEHFRLKLNKPLILSRGRWSVGLCEIQFVNVVTSPDVEHTTRHYEVSFGPCDGMILHGSPTRVLRLIPYEENAHITYTRPYYMPVHTGYIDSCEICIRTLSNVGLTKIQHVEDTCITCTLHFKKTHVNVYS